MRRNEEQRERKSRPHLLGRIISTRTVLLSCLGLTLGLLSGPHVEGKAPKASQPVPGRLLIKVKLGVEEGVLEVFHQQRQAKAKPVFRTRGPKHNAQKFQELGLDRWQVVMFPKAKRVAAMVKAYRDHPSVEVAEPDYKAELLGVTPNDPLWGSQWGPKAINCPSAWDLTTGGAEVTVAVIDSGLRASHEEFTAPGKIWKNPLEDPDQNPGALPGVDDDGNGFVDDIWGWDFSGDTLVAPGDVVEDNDPSDDDGHGTHVAGIAAATTDNNAGIAGVAWKVKVMVVKMIPNAYFSVMAAAVQYAADMGAQVTNMSWGGWTDDLMLKDAIAYSASLDVVQVAGSGNFPADIPFYPAAYPEVIAVSGLQDPVTFWPNSTFGNWIDLAAPAKNIWSATADSDTSYESMNGTSMASPHVAGVAALVRSLYPGWSASQVRARLEATAIDLGTTGRDDFFGHGRVDALRALWFSPPREKKPNIKDQPVKTLEVEGGFRLGEAYSFPNPAKGVPPTLHFECGLADEITMTLYNVAAERLGEVTLPGDQVIKVDGKYAYEYTWPTEQLGSDIYLAILRAKKNGYSDLVKTIKLAVVK